MGYNVAAEWFCAKLSFLFLVLWEVGSFGVVVNFKACLDELSEVAVDVLPPMKTQ